MASVSVKETFDRDFGIYDLNEFLGVYSLFADDPELAFDEKFVTVANGKSKVKYFVGNPQTAGYGITLTEAGTVIYFSNGYDLEKRLQSEDRAHRIGQKKSVTYIDLIAPKTVDEKIRKALRKKINIATEIMGEELREWI